MRLGGCSWFLAIPKWSTLGLPFLNTHCCSEAVLDRVIAIFKQLLFRHTPSMKVLGLLDDFCINVSEALPALPSTCE